jgi:hypothetical protein
MKQIESRIRELPPDLQGEVLDYIEFLLSRKSAASKRKPSLNWLGGLKKHRKQFTAVELQNKASLWRD